MNPTDPRRKAPQTPIARLIHELADNHRVTINRAVLVVSRALNRSPSTIRHWMAGNPDIPPHAWELLQVYIRQQSPSE